VTTLRLCTPCTQTETRITMRGIKSGVFVSTTIKAIRSRDLKCEHCDKRAVFAVTTS
jgi:hypothetical protein